VRVGIVLTLFVAVGEALRAGLDAPAYAALERLGARVGLELELDGDVGGGEPSGGPVSPVDAVAGTLSLETRPWGWAYVDGAYLGATPLDDVKLSPGYHTVRVERDGFRGYSTAVTVEAGRALELADVVLSPEGVE